MINVLASRNSILIDTNPLQIVYDLAKDEKTVDIILKRDADEEIKKFYAGNKTIIILTHKNRLFIQNKIDHKKFDLIKENVDNFIAYDDSVIFWKKSKKIYIYLPNDSDYMEYIPHKMAKCDFDHEIYRFNVTTPNNIIYNNMRDIHVVLDYGLSAYLIMCYDLKPSFYLIKINNIAKEYIFQPDLNGLILLQKNDEIFTLDRAFTKINKYISAGDQYIVKSIDCQNAVITEDEDIFIHELSIFTRIKLPEDITGFKIECIIDSSFLIAQWDLYDDSYEKWNNMVIMTNSVIALNKKYFMDQELIVFNKLGLIHYSKTEGGYLYTTHSLGRSESEISNDNMTLFCYKLEGFPSNIDLSMTISTYNYLIVSTESGNIHFLEITSNGVLPKMRMVKFKNSSYDIQTNIVNRKRDRSIYESDINIYVESKYPKFDKFITFCELSRGEVNIITEYVSGGRYIAQGNGVKRDFLHNVVDEFVKLYCVEDRVYPSFNLNKVKETPDYVAVSIGIMLHYIVTNLDSPLEYRLPIILLETIIDRKLLIDELEYFAMNQDEVIFKSIKSIEFNPEFTEISGFADYKSALEHLCRVYRDEDVTRFCTQVKTGIMICSHIQNISQMNVPTLDFYFSGPIRTSKNKLIKNITMHRLMSSSCDQIDDDISSESSYYLNFINLIHSLTDEEIRIFLKNISGYSIFSQNTNYKIYIYDPERSPNRHINYTKENDCVYYQTCVTSLYIPIHMMDNFDTANMKMHLVIPCDSMRDF